MDRIIKPKHGRARKALRYSFMDGLLTTITASLVDPFIVPAVLALGAGNMTVAVFSGTSLLFSGFAHLLSPSLAAGALGRRALVLRCVHAQALSCLLLAGAGFLGKWGIPSAVLVYAIYCAAGSVSYGPWASWMGDLVPKSGRGRYFALRSMVYGPAGGAAMLGTGLLFRNLWCESAHAPWTAFAAVFAIAAVLRFGAGLFVARQHEPPARGEKTPAEDFTYRQFLLRTGKGNFATYTVLFALLNGGATLTGPFFSMYVLRDLHCDYLTYVTFPICAIFAAMIFVRFWVRVADRWGNMFVIRIAAVLLSLIPLLYLGSDRLWPLYVGWLAGGAVWAGLNLASFNLVTETATPRRRVRCHAYMQATIGLVVAAYMFIWGALADHLPTIFHYQIQTVFLFSAVLRILPAMGMIFIVKDRVPQPEASLRDLVVELPAVRTTAYLLRELARPFNRSGV